MSKQGTVPKSGQQTAEAENEAEDPEMFAWWAVLRGPALAEAARSVLVAPTEDIDELNATDLR